MEQYVADNERLRMKVSDLGEKMEYYKGKLLKYRGMYQELTGQSETNPKTDSATATSTSQDSSTSTVPSTYYFIYAPTQTYFILFFLKK